MREIKFRAFSKKYKVIRDVFRITFGENFDTVVYTKPIDKTIAEQLSDIELMQYTGLKDRNGKDIYEGDILEHISDGNMPKGRVLVEWDSHFSKFHPFENITSVDKAWKVIGNIYENPELLNN